MLKEYAAFMSPSKLVTLMGMTLRNNAKALHLCGACHALFTNALAGWQFQSDVSPGEPDARRRTGRETRQGSDVKFIESHRDQNSLKHPFWHLVRHFALHKSKTVSDLS